VQSYKELKNKEVPKRYYFNNTSEAMNNIASPYKVIAVGKKQSGKSSILNSLTYSKYFGTDSSGTMKDVQFLTRKFKGRFGSPDITFVDTPGFSDNTSKDKDTIAKTATTLSSLEHGINLILFCFPAYEIPLDSSMQAGWNFLRLVLSNAIYEDVIIVLTHGNRLTSQELEEAVARLTTEFIPYIKDNLKCKVKDEILIYKNEGSDDGLDGVLGYIITNKEYKAGMIGTLEKFWRPENPLASIEYLLLNSKILNQIQDLVLNVKERNTYLEQEIKLLRLELESVKIEKEREKKEEIEKIFLRYQEQLKNELNSLQIFKKDIEAQIIQLQEELGNKDKKIENLTKQLEDIKASTKKDTLLLGLTNKYLQLDTKKASLKATRIDHSHLVPGNYHVAPAAEKCSDKEFSRVMETATKLINLPKPSIVESFDAVQRAHKNYTPNQTKKTPLITSQTLGMKWTPSKISTDSQQSVRTKGSRTTDIPPKPPNNVNKYVYSQPKYINATPQLLSKKYEATFRFHQYDS